MIEQELLQDALDHALRNGGEFAEVFVEDRRSSSGRFDDGRVEELVSGRDRGAGLRVVSGETTGFAHTADLSRDGLLPRGRSRAPAAARRRRPGTHVVPLTRRAGAAARRFDRRARDRRRSATRSRSSPGPTPPRAPRAARSRRSPRPTPTPAAASSSPTPTGCSPTTTRSAPASNVHCVATGDTGMQTAHEAPGRTMGFELFDAVPARGRRPHGGAPRAHVARRGARAVGPSPGRAAARRGRRAVPRGVRPRPRSRPHPEGRERVQGPRRRAGRVAVRHDRRRRRLRPRVGHDRDRRRGPSRAAQRADRERRPHRLHVGRRARPQGGARRRAATAGARATAICRCRA